MLKHFHTEVLAKHARLNARVTRITTPHGQITTPCFMPVGTRAAVNCMAPQQLLDAGSQIILGGNTYHMLIAPGLDTIRAAGGMHQMMAWPYPMLTDSGGYQVFSLSRNRKLCKIDEQGAHFKHPINGKVIHLTPASSITAQKIIGADIIMAFDQCTPEEGGRDMALKAMARTHRWLLESIAIHQQQTTSAYGFEQALFGIIQGGRYQDLREQSAQFILEQDLPGVAIGGETIGYDMEKTQEIIQWLEPMLPVNKPRYTMGVGLQPEDLIAVVRNGIDMFDCVAATRNARHGALYCGQAMPKDDWVEFVSEHQRSRLLIKKSVYAQDDKPIDEACQCYTCQHFSRAYLHYLFKEKQALYTTLACIHNIRVLHQTCECMRDAIMENSTSGEPTES